MIKFAENLSPYDVAYSYLKRNLSTLKTEITADSSEGPLLSKESHALVLRVMIDKLANKA